MNKEKRRVPKLRFPGFTEDWEQCKLSEVVTINPKTELPDEFKYVDLESVVGTNLLGFQVIKKGNAPSRAQRLASYGDVFYQTVRPYQRNNYLFENIDKDMVFSTGYAQLRSKLDSYFLLTLVQNDNFVKVVLDNCTGTSYPAINGSELGKITVQIPSNDAEANQIGKVFRGIDNIITLHQRKLEYLNLKKKALLQKLFPKNGERYPELRFPGFTDAWEQRKLIDTAKTFIGLVTTMTENYRDSGTLLIRNSDIKEGQFVFSEKPIHLDEEFAEKNKTRRLQIGDVVTVHTGDIGTSAVIQEKEAGAIGFATINTRTDKRILNPYFLSTYFNTEKHKCYANSVSTGDGRSNYNIKDFNKLVISIPTLDEQEKISALINNINTIITLHQRKLEHLQLQKKALLQQMFV